MQISKTKISEKGMLRKVDGIYKKCAEIVHEISSDILPWAVQFDLIGLQNCIDNGVIQVDFPSVKDHVFHTFYVWESWKHWSDRFSAKIREDSHGKPASDYLDADDDKKFKHWAKVAYVYIVVTYLKMLEASQ